MVPTGTARMLLHVMVTELRQQFPLTIFYPDNSLTCSTFLDVSLTSFKFPDISSFCRQVDVEVVNNNRLITDLCGLGSVVRYPRYLDTYRRYLRGDTSIAKVTIYRGIS